MDSAGIPWYSTGTVNVTQGSSNVAGVGTNWVNAGLKVGDIFTIDKSRLYQITAINSNTSLSLQEAYQGATGTAQVYFVIRNFAATMQAQIAAQVSELVNKYESYIDTELKQITGPAGPTSFPYRGTWATGRSYNALDVVDYNGALFVAVVGHTSTSENAPGASGTRWEKLNFDISAVERGGHFKRALMNASIINQLDVGGVDLVGESDGEIKARYVRFLPRDKKIEMTHYDGTNWTSDMIIHGDDTGWIKLSDDYNGMFYRVKSRVLYIRLVQNNLAIPYPDGVLIGTLPQEYRTTNGIQNIYFVNYIPHGAIRLNSDGTVRLQPTSQSLQAGANSWVIGTFSYPL